MDGPSTHLLTNPGEPRMPVANYKAEAAAVELVRPRQERGRDLVGFHSARIVNIDGRPYQRSGAVNAQERESVV